MAKTRCQGLFTLVLTVRTGPQPRLHGARACAPACRPRSRVSFGPRIATGQPMTARVGQRLPSHAVSPWPCAVQVLSTQAQVTQTRLRQWAGAARAARAQSPRRGGEPWAVCARAPATDARRADRSRPCSRRESSCDLRCVHGHGSPRGPTQRRAASVRPAQQTNAPAPLEHEWAVFAPSAQKRAVFAPSAQQGLCVPCGRFPSLGRGPDALHGRDGGLPQGRVRRPALGCKAAGQRKQREGSCENQAWAHDNEALCAWACAETKSPALQGAGGAG